MKYPVYILPNWKNTIWFVGTVRAVSLCEKGSILVESKSIQPQFEVEISSLHLLLLQV